MITRIDVEGSKEGASQVLDAIAQLERLPAFQSYYLRRLREKRDEAAADVLDNDALTPEERERRRAAYVALRDVLRMTGQDKVGAERALKM